MKGISGFIERSMLSADCYDPERDVKRILEDMDAGLHGRKSSMFMLPSYLPCGRRPREGEPVIVLDAGGTNLRTAVVTIENGEVKSESFSKRPMPGSRRRLRKDAFFDEIAEAVAPIADRSDELSFCFSYVARPLPDHDAEVHALCKEVDVDGIEGVRACGELSAALKRRGVKCDHRSILLNDSTAGLLGGISELENPDGYGGFAGVILGTGFNICYRERTDEIGTAHGYDEDNMIINTEAGCYGGFARGPVDDELDRESAIPGDHRAEKMISGAYLGELILRAAVGAAAEGIFSGWVHGLKELSLIDVNAFLDGGGELWSTVPESERADLKALVEAVYGRAALLAACLLTACCVRMKGTCRGEIRAAALCDGSTLLKSPYLLSEFKRRCDMLGRRFGIETDIIPSSGATLKGAACAALQFGA